MILDLLKHKDYLRILLAVQQKPLRFSQIQKILRLNPAQVDRALRFLCQEFLILPRTVPTPRGRLPVEYSLGKRGIAFLESFKTFNTAVRRRRGALGPSEIVELQNLSR